MRVLKSKAGNIAIMAALMLGGVSVVILGGVDFMSVASQNQLLQSVADRAALAAAQELVVARADDDRVTAVANSFVNANYDGEHQTVARVIESGKAVEVTITATPRTYFNTPFSGPDKLVSADAVAEVSGGGSICMIGLDETAIATIKMMNNARLSAEACAVYSNSRSDKSLWLQDSARLSAELVCVAGGIRGPETGFKQSQPVLDCPQIDDPLRDRPAPDFDDTCDYKATVVPFGKIARLRPGVYCGGITVLGGLARLDPGLYVLKNGPLLVTGNGTLEGKHVGFYLTGSAALIRFAQFSHVSLSAPRTGDMAGLLFFEDRETTFAAYHQITSRDARNIVGTIYLPRSKLLIDARDPVADQSDYTIIIAREFELRDGPELVLNTDYAGSDIPVPEGVGNNTPSSIRLAR
jgi:hypothetical protein